MAGWDRVKKTRESENLFRGMRKNVVFLFATFPEETGIYSVYSPLKYK
jgi:hypothetical protein